MISPSGLLRFVVQNPLLTPELREYWDYVRALGEVLAATGAVHYASALDAPELPCGVDVELSDGDVIWRFSITVQIWRPCLSCSSRQTASTF